MYQILRHEFTREIEDGYIEDLEVLCQKYRIRSIFDNDVREEEITKAGKSAARRQIWNKLLECKTIPLRDARYEKLPEHYLFTDFQSRLVSQMRMGVLMFRNKYSQYMRKRHQGDQSCLWGPCGEIDSLAHCIQCEFYPVRFRKTGKGEASDWAEYLTQLSNFRARIFGESLEFLAYENKTSTCNEREYEKSLKSAYEIEMGDIKEVKSKLQAYRKKSREKSDSKKAMNKPCDKFSQSDMNKPDPNANANPNINEKLLFQSKNGKAKCYKSDQLSGGKKHLETHREKQECDIPISLCSHLEHVSCKDKENLENFKRFKGKSAVHMCEKGEYARNASVQNTTASGESCRTGGADTALSADQIGAAIKSRKSRRMEEDDKEQIMEKNKDRRGEFEWCEGNVYGNKVLKTKEITPCDPRHSKFVDPFYQSPTGSGHPHHHLSIDFNAKSKSLTKSLNKSGYNSNNIFELHHTPRYNSHVNSKPSTQQNQKMFHEGVQSENDSETVKLSRGRDW